MFSSKHQNQTINRHICRFWIFIFRGELCNIINHQVSIQGVLIRIFEIVTRKIKCHTLVRYTTVPLKFLDSSLIFTVSQSIDIAHKKKIQTYNPWCSEVVNQSIDNVKIKKKMYYTEQKTVSHTNFGCEPKMRFPTKKMKCTRAQTNKNNRPLDCRAARRK